MEEISELGIKRLSKICISDSPTRDDIHIANAEANADFTGSNSTYSTHSGSQHGQNRFNQSTVLLHEACESGDRMVVERILATGRAQLDVLMAGHRAYRTALQKASSYGHTGVVRLLLKAGADADKTSSVQRTALHEACMGGHKETVMELVQYVKDLNVKDNRGQSAAHIAAYHGETDCLKLLVDNGCDVNCEDNQSCTPAHLATIKDHSGTLRCLLEKNSVDILKRDGQGKTAVHYAAQYGSIGCLKVFKELRVDLQVTDQAGGNASHHASAGGHLQCLKLLTKVGILLDGKDNSGRTNAHYAAQKGSTECLHWLLEQGLNASITDDSGNTPAHCASSGRMEAMNCLALHNSNMSLTNNLGDTPEMLARKYGHTMAFQKAVSGIIKCPFCIKKRAQLEYDLAHKPSEVEKSIRLEEKVLFKSPIRKESTTKSKSKKKAFAKRDGVHASNSKRNLSSQYYGDHLFSWTAAEQTSLTQTQRNVKK